MIWLNSVRTFLHDLKLFKSASPNKMQLEQLHIEILDIDVDDQQISDNIKPILDFLISDKWLSQIYCMEVGLHSAKTARFYSRYVSSVLVTWIMDMAEQASQKFQITRNQKLRIKNDSYSSGICTLLILSSPHKTKRIVPLLSIIIRERNRPEHLLSSAELYVAFAMAAKQRSLEDIETINVRVLVVFSSWVQVVTVTTTPLYVKSIIQGSECIIDKMTIHRTRWFNFLDYSGRLGVLLSASEDINLELPCPKDMDLFSYRKRPISTLEKFEKLEDLRKRHKTNAD